MLAPSARYLQRGDPDGSPPRPARRHRVHLLSNPQWSLVAKVVPTMAARNLATLMKVQVTVVGATASPP